MEQEDYSKIYEYESMGKEYAGEKACISLTSWKARINIVSKTLYSLLKMCPGFHIVLVLSKDEFPLMEKELPDNLMLFVENKLIELFWIRPNLKSFKKVLFTMDKYKNIPVISADDDCIYTCNFAEKLYNKWLENKNCFISVWQYPTNYKNTIHGFGCISLHPPYYYGEYGLKFLNEKVIDRNQDDDYYMVLRSKLNLNEYAFIPGRLKDYLEFHDSISPLSAIYEKNSYTNISVSVYEREIKV